MATKTTRRRFLKASSAAIAACAAPTIGLSQGVASKRKSDRPRIACIGLKYQGTVIAEKAIAHGDLVALCDVDRKILDMTRAKFGGKADVFEDYRDLLARDDIDVVLIGTPDHWHAKMLIDSCRAGKDVYCEKPLTLTIDEGKVIRNALRQSSQVVQVGSWQRSDERYRMAVEMVRQGRIGKLERVEVVLAKNPVGGPFQVKSPPPHLNWDLWQGQTPDVPYIPERCHYTFRWWQEYSGGKMTDWGAHHVDIAQWAINEFPIEIESTAKYPEVTNGYNVPIDFTATYRYPSGVVLSVKDTGRNGVLFHGSEGRIFVNRETLAGKPIDDLAKRPFGREQYTLYPHDNFDRPPRSGKLEAIVNHMGNFFDCIKSRQQPISDLESQHRSVTTCHLGNLSMRLGRTLKWDPKAEEFPGDVEANALLKRAQREGFEVG